MNVKVATINNIKGFTGQCFDGYDKESQKAAEIVKGILDSHSPRISDISTPWKVTQMPTTR